MKFLCKILPCKWKITIYDGELTTIDGIQKVEFKKEQCIRCNRILNDQPFPYIRGTWKQLIDGKGIREK